PDGDAVTYLYDWTVNDVSTGATGSTLAPSASVRGDVVRVIITPTDGTTAGAPATSDPLTILNTAPTAFTLDLQPNLTHSNQSLNTPLTPPRTDLDGDTIRYTYYWQKNGATIPINNDPTLPTSSYAKGATITVTAVPSDGTDDGPSSTDSVLILNTAPSFTG